MMLQSGDVPCYVILSGVQAARSIGKAGALIKELREESGATINILDRPPAIPEVFQRNQQRVALIKGSEKAMHTAITGLVRNLRGPESVRSLEQEGEPGSDDVDFIIPEKCVPYLSDNLAEELIGDIGCNLQVNTIEGVQRHRHLRLLGTTTHNLQVAAWRVHDLLLRLAESNVLLDKDFDLQDSSWDVAMRAFQSRRKSPEEEAAAAAARPSVRLPSRDSTLRQANDFEQESRRLKEVQEHEAQEISERERKARLREAQARSAREREMLARESKALQDKARETWLRATRVQGDPSEYDALVQEAQQYERQASEARAQALHDNEKQRQHQTEAGDLERAAREKQLREQEAQQRRAQEEQERQERERQAQELQAKTREARRLADEMHKVREARVTQERERAAQEREAREQARLAPEPVVDQHHVQRYAADMRDRQSHAVPQNRQVDAPITSKPSSNMNHGRDQPDVAGDSILCLLLPSFDASNYLANGIVAIGSRAGVKIAAESGAGGFPVLRIQGTPLAVASACFLVQEELWMTGMYAQS